MACHPSLLLLALLFAASASFANATITISGREVVQLNITGLIICTADGNGVPGCIFTCRGIVGANVFLSCDDGQTRLSNAVSKSLGYYQFVFTSFDGSLIDQSKCAAYIPLPVARACSALPGTGTLVGVVNLFGFEQTDVGLVATCGVRQFQRI